MDICKKKYTSPKLFPQQQPTLLVQISEWTRNINNKKNIFIEECINELVLYMIGIAEMLFINYNDKCIMTIWLGNRNNHKQISVRAITCYGGLFILIIQELVIFCNIATPMSQTCQKTKRAKITRNVAENTLKVFKIE